MYKKLISQLDKNECFGCEVCSNVCGVNAISMEADSEGFIYPKINTESCLKCGKCIKVCPSLNRKVNNIKPAVFAAWSKDSKTRFESTSGGLFTEVAKAVINENGYAVGARYNKNNEIEHFIVNNEEDLSSIRQSKYAQSRKRTIYKEVKELLDAGNKVLFAGAPCEVAALVSFLDYRYKNLFLCDFVCKGCNSPKVFKKYLEFVEDKYKSKIKRVWFKYKRYGWNRFSTKIELENGKKYVKDRYSDLYMRGYIEENLYIRPSCAKCVFKNTNSKADITLGDFWGIKKIKSKLDDDKGTSIFMINTEKGREIFNKIKENIYYEEMEVNMINSGNVCFKNTTAMNEHRDEFFKYIDTMAFDKLVKRFFHFSIKRTIRVFLIRVLSYVNKLIILIRF